MNKTSTYTTKENRQLSLFLYTQDKSTKLKE